MTSLARCQVFIGSSSEGKAVARALQAELLPDCEVTCWDQGVFEPGGYTLDSLITMAHRCDFAVLVATPDDIRESRGQTAAVPRDNIILEFGLFAGILGRDRTYVLATGGARLPTDTLGLTRLSYYDQQNLRSAVSAAADEMRDRMVSKRQRIQEESVLSSGLQSVLPPLEAELDLLADNAVAQGWTVKNSKTTLRLTSPKGKTHTLTKSTAQATRDALRPFAAQLRAGGLRVNAALRRPIAESPFS